MSCQQQPPKDETVTRPRPRSSCNKQHCTNSCTLAPKGDCVTDASWQLCRRSRRRARRAEATALSPTQQSASSESPKENTPSAAITSVPSQRSKRRAPVTETPLSYASVVAHSSESKACPARIPETHSSYHTSVILSRSSESKAGPARTPETPSSYASVVANSSKSKTGPEENRPSEGNPFTSAASSRHSESGAQSQPTPSAGVPTTTSPSNVHVRPTPFTQRGNPSTSASSPHDSESGAQSQPASSAGVPTTTTPSHSNDVHARPPSNQGDYFREVQIGGALHTIRVSIRHFKQCIQVQATSTVRTSTDATGNSQSEVICCTTRVSILHYERVFRIQCRTMVRTTAPGPTILLPRFPSTQTDAINRTPSRDILQARTPASNRTPTHTDIHSSQTSQTRDTSIDESRSSRGVICNNSVCHCRSRRRDPIQAFSLAVTSINPTVPSSTRRLNSSPPSHRDTTGSAAIPSASTLSDVTTNDNNLSSATYHDPSSNLEVGTESQSADQEEMTASNSSPEVVEAHRDHDVTPETGTSGSTLQTHGTGRKRKLAPPNKDGTSRPQINYHYDLKLLDLIEEHVMAKFQDYIRRYPNWLGAPKSTMDGLMMEVSVDAIQVLKSFLVWLGYVSITLDEIYGDVWFFDTIGKLLAMVAQNTYFGDRKPRLRMYRYANPGYSLDEESRPQCCICLGDIEHGDIVRDLPCTHTLHQTCVDHWFKVSNRCPMCRTVALPSLQQLPRA